MLKTSALFLRILGNGRFSILLLAAGIAICLTASPAANASLFLTPSGAGLMDGSTALNALKELTTGTQTSQSQINTAIASILGSSTELYKQDVTPPSESGTFASSYSTAFANSLTDPADATISYGSGPAILGATHVLVKDGNQTPAWYLFNIAGLWNGTDSIVAFNFWPSNGAISHVTIYGTAGPPTGTGLGAPEPCALLVWGGLIFATIAVVPQRRRTPIEAVV